MEKKEKHHHKEKEKEKESEEEYLKIECRMYEEKFPKISDLVMCRIDDIFEDGAYVELLEYNNTRGLLLSTEISRKRVNIIKRLIKKGREEVLQVLRIDPTKGYFDLSKKNVKAEEIEEFKEKYGRSKTVHNIMKLLSVKTGTNIEQLYEQFCWPLYKIYGHAYFAFKEALKQEKFFLFFSDEEAVFKQVTIDPEIRKKLMEILRVRMVTQPVKIRSDFNLICVTFEGIEAIRYALLEGEKVSTPEIQIKYHIIGSPTYECTSTTIDKKEGLKLMGESLRVVEKAIKAKGGSFSLLTSPTVLGDADKDNIKSQLDQAAEKISEEEEDIEDEYVEGIQADIYAPREIL